ncbi:MAG: hypothetical protein EBZ75_08390 [Oxalobacteraceae bacterium]|nr:hypothetical protein [Oxalobacteraceae bacterium]
MVDLITRNATRLESVVRFTDVLMLYAMGIIAEATTDMSSFPDERKFAAWAGVASGNNESAGKKKDQSAGTGTRISENS